MNDFCKTYPGVKVASTEEEILSDSTISLIAGAAVTSERGPLGLRALSAGKHYITDKAPFTTLGQLELAKKRWKKQG